MGLAGRDFIDGGTGFDEAAYFLDPAGVMVNLTIGVAIDGFGDTDDLRNIEGAVGSEFDDRLTGSRADNDLFGLGGDDILHGGLGFDLIDGGPGFDVVIYDDDTGTGVTVNLAAGTATDGVGDTDSLFSVEEVRGSAWADTLIGGADDFFEAFVGLAGNDFIDGGTGFDEVSYIFDPAGVTVDFVAGITDGFGGTDTLQNIESVRGTQFDDTLSGDINDNIFYGLDGADTLSGGSGNFRVGTADGETFKPVSAIAALSDGGFVVTWQSSDGSDVGVFGQRFDASGTPVGSEFQANTFTTAFQGAPKVTALSDGGFVVVWASSDFGSSGQDGSFGDVFGQRYDAAGDAVGAEFRANTNTSGDQGAAVVAGLSDGGFVVTWNDSSGQDGSGTGIFGQRYDAAGATVGGEFQANTFTPGGQFASSVSALSDGGFVVTWISGDGSLGGIFGQRYDSAGNPSNGEFPGDSPNDVASGVFGQL